MSSLMTQAQASDPQAVFQRLERFYDEMGADQIDAAMNLYAPDAQILLPEKPSVTGREHIRTWWEATLKEYRFRAVPKLIEATDVGDAVILQGEACGQLVPRSGGASVNIDIWFVQIYRRQSNGDYLFWRGASGPNPRRRSGAK